MLSEFDDINDDQQARLDAIDEQLDELNSRESVWTPETLAMAGAVVTVGTDGKAAVHCGYVRPEDAPRKTARTQAALDGRDDTAEDTCPLPASLIESLTAQRSAALNAALLDRPDVALAATVHAIALQVFYNGCRGDTALQLIAKEASQHLAEGARAQAVIEAAREHWMAQIPGDPSGLFAWCLAQTDTTLRAFARLLRGADRPCNGAQGDRSDSTRLAHAADLAKAVSLDMAAWFAPTANYFGRVSKAIIIEALRETKGSITPAWSGLKKSDLAALAERQIAGTGWLPEPLRAPVAIDAQAHETAA